MGEFITLQIGDDQRSATINTDHIIKAEAKGSGHCILTLSNGDTHQVVNKMYTEVSAMLTGKTK